MSATQQSFRAPVDVKALNYDPNQPYNQPYGYAPPTQAYQHPVGQQHYTGPVSAGNPAMMLHVYDISNMFQRRELNVTMADKKSVAFVASFNSNWSSKPDIELHKGTKEGPLVGSSKFHSFSSKTDINLPNSQCPQATLAKQGAFSRKYDVTFDNQPFVWKNHTEGLFPKGSHKLVDQNDRVVAYYHRSKHALTKWGKIEITAPGLSDSMIEGIVITALTLAERDRRARNSRAAGGGGGGGGGCGGG